MMKCCHLCKIYIVSHKEMEEWRIHMAMEAFLPAPGGLLGTYIG